MQSPTTDFEEFFDMNIETEEDKEAAETAIVRTASSNLFHCIEKGPLMLLEGPSDLPLCFKPSERERLLVELRRWPAIDQDDPDEAYRRAIANPHA